jgi:hypothetical protein
MGVALHAFTVFLSALLLMAVQPMLGKRVLPWFGGTPGVWSACLLFFQAELFLGYALAHGLVRRAGPRLQLAVLVLLLGAASLLLPLGPAAGARPSTSAVDPAIAVLLLLAANVGLPYLALSATAPLVQHWFARSGARSPYALYACSNAGSLLGLLSYPFLIEPQLDLSRQAVLWSRLYALYAVALLSSCALALRAPAGALQPAQDTQAAAARPGTRRVLEWFALSAIGSVLLVAGTNYITVDVAAFPLLWVVPLALYLLTFILAFSSERVGRRALLLPLWAACTGLLGVALFAQGMASIAYQLGAVLAAIFVGCLLCHAELWRARPPAEQLSRFYLWVAAGGAAGGLFVALIAPRLFRGFYELQLAVFASYAVLLSTTAAEPDPQRKRSDRRMLWLGVGLASSLIVATLYADNKDRSSSGHVIEQRRGFFGVLRVTRLAAYDVQVLTHGRIRHGMQWLAPERRRQPTMYYAPESGIGRVLSVPARAGGRHVGVVGLGAGSIAAYARKGDRFRFYELDPDVVDLARTRFSFLRDSPATIEVAIGDGRILLEREPANGFDVLVADAFASDAVPAHLLTVEAFGIYLRHLRSDGLLVVNAANRHIDVGRVVAGSARRHGLALRIIDTPSDVERGFSRARWALLARDARLLDAVAPASAAMAPSGPPVIWTDDFSDLLSVLR